MNNLSNNRANKGFGSLPANLKWNVVRGDTASILVQFLESDEETSYDTDTWTYISSAYDHETGITYILDTETIGSSVKITAGPETTSLWGTRFLDKVADLSFDLQVTMDFDVVWTPIVGKISVIGNVTLYDQGNS
jgi:hypothetical protein